jgi:hypothetical protein
MSEEKKERIRFSVVEFKNYTQASYKYDNGQPWVSWGEFNGYPEYLVELYNRSAIHGSIVKGKGHYVYGKGLTYTGGDSVLDQAKALAWLDKANRYESWNEVYAKTARTFELFNGFAWQIIWNKGKTAFEVYHLDIAKLRRSKCGKKVFYCEAWLIDNYGELQENPHPENHETYKEFPIFNPNVKTTSVFYYRLEVPTSLTYSHLYPTVDYSGALMPIETLIEIDVFRNSHLKHGMFASALVSLFNGMPTPEEEKKIKKMFDFTHVGSKNAGKAILNFVDSGGTAADIKSLSQSDLDKMFEGYEKSCIQEVFSAHRVHPILFGVMTEGSLSDTGGEAVIKKWDQFQRAYVEGRQEIILNQIKYLGTVQGIDLSGLEVEQMTPVGLELPLDAVVLGLFDQATLRKHFAKKYGIEDSVPELQGEQMEALPTNDNIKNLTGLQYKRIQGYIAKYKSGKITYEEASHFIKGYGLGDDYIKMVLKRDEFKSQEKVDTIISLFEKFAIQDDDSEVLFEETVKDDVGSLKLEFKAHNFLTQKELENSVLDMITGNPSITPEQIARQIQITPEEATAIITTLITAGLILSQSGVLNVTDKGLKKEVEPVETEVYTVYKYVTRGDVPKAKSGSRPFCTRLLALSSAGKRWTREAIENISNAFGEDAWTYRGGFYHNPQDNETTPYCRHIWVGVVKTRKKGGSNA